MHTQTKNGMSLQLMEAQPIVFNNKSKSAPEPLLPAGVQANEKDPKDTKEDKVQANEDGIKPMYPVGANVNNETVQTNEIKPMLPTQINGKQ